MAGHDTFSKICLSYGAAAAAGSLLGDVDLQDRIPERHPPCLIPSDCERGVGNAHCLVQCLLRSLSLMRLECTQVDQLEQPTHGQI